jgi:hypothetical protein
LLPGFLLEYPNKQRLPDLDLDFGGNDKLKSLSGNNHTRAVAILRVVLEASQRLGSKQQNKVPERYDCRPF